MVVRAQRGRVLPHDARSSASCTTSCRRRRSGRSTRYRLSIIHFWALVFIYIWAGPHHLLYTALPDWAQTLGHDLQRHALGAVAGAACSTACSRCAAPGTSCATDPVLKFFAAGITFYGMATFEGPLLSIKSGQRARALHRLDHRPRARRRARLERLHGRRDVLLARAAALRHQALLERRSPTTHFWIGTVGILLYVVAMWVAGITQGLMWRGDDENGALLYPTSSRRSIAIRRCTGCASSAARSTSSAGLVIWTPRQRSTATWQDARDRGQLRGPVDRGDPSLGPDRLRSSSRRAPLDDRRDHRRVARRIASVASPRGRAGTAAWRGPGRCPSRLLHAARGARRRRRRDHPDASVIARQRADAIRPRSSRTRRSSSRAATSTCARVATPATRR